MKLLFVMLLTISIDNSDQCRVDWNDSDASRILEAIANADPQGVDAGLNQIKQLMTNNPLVLESNIEAVDGFVNRSNKNNLARHGVVEAVKNGVLSEPKKCVKSIQYLLKWYLEGDVALSDWSLASLDELGELAATASRKRLQNETAKEESIRLGVLLGRTGTTPDAGIIGAVLGRFDLTNSEKYIIARAASCLDPRNGPAIAVFNEAFVTKSGDDRFFAATRLLAGDSADEKVIKLLTSASSNDLIYYRVLTSAWRAERVPDPILKKIEQSFAESNWPEESSAAFFEAVVLFKNGVRKDAAKKVIADRSEYVKRLLETPDEQWYAPVLYGIVQSAPDVKSRCEALRGLKRNPRLNRRALQEISDALSAICKQQECCEPSPAPHGQRA